MTPNDIVFTHSGGLANCDPDLDLGGTNSGCALDLTALNNLFDDLTPKESREGLIDYRCFYINNTHPTDTLRNAVLYIDSEKKGGSFIDIGIPAINEIQKLEIQGTKPPNEGEVMTLSFAEFGDVTIPYHVIPTIWQGNFQTEVRGLDSLAEVIIEYAGEIGFPTDVVFTINFRQQSGSKDISLISVISPTDLGGQSFTVTQYQQGKPVNTVAVTIADKETAPAGIEFSYPLRGSPISLGNLLPGDSFPVWVRRITPEGTVAHLLDNYILNVEGTSP